MTHPEELSQWTETVTRELPHLSRAQARVPAWWSYGMVLTQSCHVGAALAGPGVAFAPSLHAARLRGSRLQGPLVRAHRPGSRRLPGGMVWRQTLD